MEKQNIESCLPDDPKSSIVEEFLLCSILKKIRYKLGTNDDKNNVNNINVI